MKPEVPFHALLIQTQMHTIEIIPLSLTPKKPVEKSNVFDIIQTQDDQWQMLLKFVTMKAL
jgi:hypothetical protein